MGNAMFVMRASIRRQAAQRAAVCRATGDACTACGKVAPLNARLSLGLGRTGYLCLKCANQRPRPAA